MRQCAYTNESIQRNSYTVQSNLKPPLHARTTRRTHQRQRERQPARLELLPSLARLDLVCLPCSSSALAASLSALCVLSWRMVGHGLARGVGLALARASFEFDRPDPPQASGSQPNCKPHTIPNASDHTNKQHRPTRAHCNSIKNATHSFRYPHGRSNLLRRHRSARTDSCKPPLVRSQAVDVASPVRHSHPLSLSLSPPSCLRLPPLAFESARHFTLLYSPSVLCLLV